MKKTRKEREQEIIAQMEEALKENAEKESSAKQEKTAEESKKENGAKKTMEPLQIHCHKCNTLMENGKCPKCGHTVYVPMDEAKQKKIRLIVGAVFVVILVIVLVLTK